MKKLFLLTILFSALMITGCRPKDPAILKVFVRSATNQLVNGARVVVIGDQQSNPATLEFVDTSYTNSSGFTTVDMDQYFDTYPEIKEFMESTREIARKQNFVDTIILSKTLESNAAFIVQ